MLASSCLFIAGVFKAQNIMKYMFWYLIFSFTLFCCWFPICWPHSAWFTCCYPIFSFFASVQPAIIWISWWYLYVLTHTKCASINRKTIVNIVASNIGTYKASPPSGGSWNHASGWYTIIPKMEPHRNKLVITVHKPIVSTVFGIKSIMVALNFMWN